MTLTDSLRHVIAIKDSLLDAAATRSVMVNVPHESVVTKFLPSLIGALIGGSMAVFGAMKAQEHRARVEDRRAYRQLRNILMDEVFSLAMRCSAWSTFIRDT